MLVDLYQYLPVKIKTNMQARVKTALGQGKKRYANVDNQQSTTLIKEIDIDRVLNLNHESASLTQLKKTMSVLGARLMAKFRTVASIFRYFDIKLVGAVTFTDFAFGID